MTPITYLSEQPADYAKAVDGADSLSALRGVLADWKELAADAETVALSMTEADFKWFRRGLVKERKGGFAGEQWAEKFSDILLPARMFKISIRANEFKVPFGAMYLRLKQLGVEP